MKRTAMGILMALSLVASEAHAGVLGMVTAHPHNQMTMTARLYDGAPYLAIAQSGRNCPIQFAPGSVLLPELMPKDRDGHPTVLLSLFDDEPNGLKCATPEKERTKSSLKVFDLKRLFDQLGNKDASEAFFQKGAKLVLELQVVPHGEYDTSLHHVIIDYAQLGEKPLVVYQSQAEDPNDR